MNLSKKNLNERLDHLYEVIIVGGGGEYKNWFFKKDNPDGETYMFNINIGYH